MPLLIASAVAPAGRNAAPWLGWVASAPIRIHGHAADAMVPAGFPLRVGNVLVSGAVINVFVFPDIRSHQAQTEPNRVCATHGIRATRAPDHHIAGPIIHFARSWAGGRLYVASIRGDAS